MFYEPVLSYLTLRDALLLSGLLGCAGHVLSPGGLLWGLRGNYTELIERKNNVSQRVCESMTAKPVWQVVRVLFFIWVVFLDIQSVVPHCCRACVTSYSLKWKEKSQTSFKLTAWGSCLILGCRQCVVMQHGCLLTSRPAGTSLFSKWTHNRLSSVTSSNWNILKHVFSVTLNTFECYIWFY